jgi:chromosome segregation ATPase
MNIFNDKNKVDTKGQLSLDDYELRIEERKEELNKLNDILRGMRAEVSNQMDEIKKVTDELVKKNAEKFLLDQEVESLDNDYQILRQNVEEHQNILVKLRSDSDRINEEIKSSLIIQDELTKLKNEFDLISEQLVFKKTELIKLNDEKNLDKHEPENKENINNLKRTEKAKNCIAKTKNGIKCKRLALENSNYCKQHSKLERK